MKTIIAGSRNFNDYQILVNAIAESGFIISEVVSGGARGADSLGEKWAVDNLIPLKVFPADWNKHGKSAGCKRNVQMADYAEALIAIPVGESRGTRHMIMAARQRGLKVFVKEIP